MKRQRRKERKDHANQPGLTATGRGQETQEERIEGQSAKQNEKRLRYRRRSRRGGDLLHKDTLSTTVYRSLKKPNRQAVRRQTSQKKRKIGAHIWSTSGRWLHNDRRQSVQGPSNRHPAALPDHPCHMGGISAARRKMTGAARQSGSNADDPATGPGERQGERSIT